MTQPAHAIIAVHGWVALHRPAAPVSFLALLILRTFAPRPALIRGGRPVFPGLSAWKGEGRAALEWGPSTLTPAAGAAKAGASGRHVHPGRPAHQPAPWDVCTRALASEPIPITRALASELIPIPAP